MALSDLQIVSGVAVLVSAYYSAMHNGLSGYHWEMVIRISWFSTITHLAALSCLRTYLHQNQVKRTLRLVLMGCLAVMLIYATMVTANSNFNASLPARCFLERGHRPTNIDNIDVFFSVMLLVYNILLRILKLHRTIAEGFTGNIKRLFVGWARKVIGAILMHSGFLDHYPRSRMAIHTLLVQPFVAILVLGKTYYLMYTSTTAEASNLQSTYSWA